MMTNGIPDDGSATCDAPTVVNLWRRQATHYGALGATTTTSLGRATYLCFRPEEAHHPGTRRRW